MEGLKLIYLQSYILRYLLALKSRCIVDWYIANLSQPNCTGPIQCFSLLWALKIQHLSIKPAKYHASNSVHILMFQIQFKVQTDLKQNTLQCHKILYKLKVN